MKLLDIIDKDLINADLKSKSKAEVLGELAKMVAEKEGLDIDQLVHVLEEREKLGSTGIGDGIAIPHGKLKGLKKLVASFGKSGKGVNFDMFISLLKYTMKISSLNIFNDLNMTYNNGSYMRNMYI